MSIVMDGAVASGSERALDFASVYQAHFHDVERWLRAMGIPESDREDIVQEVFLVVRRKLGAFDGRNLAGWLFRIASLTASDHRRRAWFKNLFHRREDRDLESFAWSGADPAENLERRQAEQQLYRILAGMSEKRRTAFVFYEIECLSGEEIAGLLEIPLATVWTRLHHARKDFLERVAELQAKERA